MSTPNYKLTSTTTPSLPPLLSSSSSSASSIPPSVFIFNTLPLDCTSYILSFLGLVDCLTFGSTSSSGLGAIQDDLNNRRRKIFLSRCRQKRSTTTTTDDISSLLHRVDVLHSIIPDSHPLRDEISYLFSLLLSTDDEEDDDEEEESSSPKITSTTSTPTTTTTTTHHLLQKIHSTLLIHRLHATILHRCMTPTDLLPPPPPQPPSHHHHQQRRHHHHHCRLNTKLTANLSRYIGDVLCVAYLLPSHPSIVDGSPSLLRWMNSLTLELTRRRILSPATWYQIWIFLHCVLLRLLPRSCRRRLLKRHDVRRRRRRNVEEEEEEDEIDDDVGFSLPTIPSSFLWRLKVILKTLRDAYESCSPRFTFCDFGTLGPTFRGRDHVRSFDLLTSTVCIMILDIIKRVEWPMVTQQGGRDDGRGEEEEHVVLMRSLGWMVKVHSEAGMTRPMTVEGPVVTFATRM